MLGSGGVKGGTLRTHNIPESERNTAALFGTGKILISLPEMDLTGTHPMQLKVAKLHPYQSMPYFTAGHLCVVLG